MEVRYLVIVMMVPLLLGGCRFAGDMVAQIPASLAVKAGLVPVGFFFHGRSSVERNELCNPDHLCHCQRGRDV